MTRIQLDIQSVAKLQGLSDDVEIVNEKGETVGYFRPKSVGKIFRLKDLSPFTDEELRERSKQRENARPLSDILRDLGAA
jgi:hypothetical protein